MDAIRVRSDALEEMELPTAVSRFDATKLRARDLERHRPPRGSRMAKAAIVTADVVTISLAMAIAAELGSHIGTEEAPHLLLLPAVLSLPLWIAVFAQQRLYTAAAVSSVTAEFRRILAGVATATACTTFVGVIVNAPISRVWVVLTFGCALVGVAIERCIARLVFRQARQKGRLQRRVVIVGTNPEALAVVRMLEEHPALGYDAVGLLECSTAYGVVPPVPVLGNWHEAVEIVREYDASGVVIATSAVDVPLANRLTRELMELGYHVELTSGLVDISADRLIARPLGRRPVMHVEPVRRSGWRAAAKRAFDVVLAGGALIISSPVLLVSAIAIKRDSGGTILFRQQRIGKDGKPFEVLKFRTMVPEAESMLANIRSMNDASGPLFKMRDDPRVTKVGKRLRGWSIDELPQLWNVLRGEMSIVGPRPALPSEAEAWNEELANRLSVKPGITGMWQVNGRSTSSFDDYVRYDLYYVDNWSLLTDLAILAKTVPAVLSRKGAY